MSAGTKEPIIVTSLHGESKSHPAISHFSSFIDVSPANMPQSRGMIGFHGILNVSPRLKLCGEKTGQA